ncbi:MAG: class I SAM-dependent methyltransferase [bacterium]|nr:MAG: class I SAM-dependent methyltransferase [bacterium]
MGFLAWLLSQCRRPRGCVGRFLARGMNREHAPMTDWALSQVSIRDSRCVLDVGCGGGAALMKLANLLPRAELHGIDYSPESLKIAARTNRHLIREGRIFIREANVSQLPYENEHFDLIIAIESHYFWPDLKEDLAELRRVMRHGGKVILVGGVYFGGKSDSRNRKLAAIGSMNCQTLAELRETLCEAEYADVEVHEEWKKGWFCIVGHKPPRGEVDYTPDA